MLHILILSVPELHPSLHTCQHTSQAHIYSLEVFWKPSAYAVVWLHSLIKSTMFFLYVLWVVCFFKIGFLCLVLGVLELTL